MYLLYRVQTIESHYIRTKGYYTLLIQPLQRIVMQEFWTNVFLSLIRESVLKLNTVYFAVEMK